MGTPPPHVEHSGSLGQSIEQKGQPWRRYVSPDGTVGIAAPIIAARHEALGVKGVIVHLPHRDRATTKSVCAAALSPSQHPSV
jgi:hypothetical protein